jgi:hypothetical protein
MKLGVKLKKLDRKQRSQSCDGREKNDWQAHRSEIGFQHTRLIGFRIPRSVWRNKFQLSALKSKGFSRARGAVAHGPYYAFMVLAA